MRWEIREVKGDHRPWKVCLSGSNGEIVYGASITKKSAEIISQRLNKNENDVELEKKGS
tara:strand:- start:145 stop:321 length:177 start_codon:yes stop_codon:yes gene_type:complete